MKFKLKNYQERVLRDLREFFCLARDDGISAAYNAIAKRKGANNRYAGTYFPPSPELKNRPHVCIRVPTAGGKTYMATRAVKIAADYMEHISGIAAPTVLWFAPTTAIAEQTLAALRNRDHPCRIALEQTFGKGPEYFQIIGANDFDILRPQDFGGRVCIVVSTTAMFRVKTREGRRVYADSEKFDEHFSRFMPSSPPNTLECNAEGAVKHSFVNLLHLARPLVVLDEAHNFLSELSREVLQRINPACILEWTATPRETGTGEPRHNVLISVSAETLQTEEMIKLPIEAAEHDDWKRAIAAAVQERARLEKIAEESDEPFRPIALYQAHNKNGEVPVTALKEHLINSEGIAAAEIAIVTADIKELDGVDMLSRDCPIQHIITVDALREGWDCPFAYVLCSVANVQSAVAIEQLLGRVMRMPFGVRRKRAELNRAYAHVPKGGGISAAADELVKVLGEKLGFDEYERQRAVQMQIADGEWNDDGFFVCDSAPIFQTERKPDFSECDADEELNEAVEVRKDDSGGFAISVREPISLAAQEAIVAATPERERAETRERLRRENDRLSWEKSPARRGEEFAPLPQFLFYSPEEEREVVVSGDSLREVAEWNEKLGDCLLSDFDASEKADQFRIYLEKERVRIAEEESPMRARFSFHETPFNETRLVAWLEREIYRRDGLYFSSALKDFARRNVAHLVGRGTSVADLSRAKYKLAEMLRARLEKHRTEVSVAVLQKYLFDNPELRAEFSFAFPPRGYNAGENPYRGRYRFNRHYYGGDRIGALDSNEEMDCAKAIDRADHVRYWIRNLPNKPHSYSLPCGGGSNFYPDFVVQLTDGRVLVVEYKGEIFLGGAERSKEIGELMEKMSGGKYFFLMPTRSDSSPPVEEQIAAKIREIMKTKT